MDLEAPASAAPGRTSPSSATDIFANVGLGSSSKEALPTVPEGGGLAATIGGKARMRLSEVQEQHDIQVAERASSKASHKAPQAWPSPGGNLPLSSWVGVDQNNLGYGYYHISHVNLAAGPIVQIGPAASGGRSNRDSYPQGICLRLVRGQHLYQPTQPHEPSSKRVHCLRRYPSDGDERRLRANRLDRTQIRPMERKGRHLLHPYSTTTHGLHPKAHPREI
mmetsp:Transcript_73983/g.203690  ORF Transcript_73983/g.203690 Transcript_73983/m.203690 type:complete len:222 (-) Transcript_73983:482-1147(-)